MIIIGYFVSNGIITTSRGGVVPVLDICDVLDELLEPYQSQGEQGQTWKFSYNIDDLAIPILRLLAPQALRDLADKESVDIEAHSRTGQIRRFRLFYPRTDGVGQCFAITDKSDPTKRFDERPEVIIWTLTSFMPDGIEPPHDAIEVESYARKILDIFAKQLKITPTPTKFYSPVNVIKPYIQGMKMPHLKDLHPKVANYSSKCMSPPWVEAYQIGYWDKAYDFDLTGAYPGILARMPDWRLGDWAESKEYQGEAFMGYCPCNVEIGKNVTLHPILTELEDDKEGMTISPTGLQKEKYLTKAQIDFIRRWKIGEVEILDGVWWFPKKLVAPFGAVINRLTRQREELAEDASPTDRLLGRWLAKKIMVGLWGYTARWDWEKNREPDEFYNPPWASEITTRVPLRDAAFIYQKKAMRSVIHMAVDGFTSDTDLALTPEEEAAGWRRSETGPTLCMSSHHSWLGQKKPEGLYLEDAIGLVKSKPGNSLWSRKFERRATLGDCMQRDNLSLLGTTIECTTTLNLRHEHNRDFPKTPKTGKDLLTKKYHSKPIHLEEEAE